MAYSISRVLGTTRRTFATAPTFLAAGKCLIKNADSWGGGKYCKYEIWSVEKRGKTMKETREAVFEYGEVAQ